MSTLLVTSGFTTVIRAVAAGISNSMAPSAALLAQLKVRYTCQKALAATCIVTATLKVIAVTFTRETCAWDSGLKAATLATSLLTRSQAGQQCPGSSLKKWQEPSSKHVTRDQLDFKILRKRKMEKWLPTAHKKCRKVYDNIKLSNKVQSMCKMHGRLTLKILNVLFITFFNSFELEHESCPGRND